MEFDTEGGNIANIESTENRLILGSYMIILNALCPKLTSQQLLRVVGEDLETFRRLKHSCPLAVGLITAVRPEPCILDSII